MCVVTDKREKSQKAFCYKACSTSLYKNLHHNILQYTVGNGVRSDVKGDRHRKVQEADGWNHCVAAPRFACFQQ